MSIIDNEIKKLIFTLIGACVLLLSLVWLASNSSLLNSITSKVSNNITGVKTYDASYNYNLDKNKKYTLTVSTNQGDMTFSLDKENAPDTVNNIVNLTKNDFYKGSTFIQKKPDYILLGKGNTYENTNYKIREEINAQSLDLDKVKVGNYTNSLKSVYDETLLRNNAEKTLMDFYKSIGYTYKTNITSKPVIKGSLVMYSETPNGFSNQFFIATNSPLQYIEGRMTVFGQLSSGMDTLSKLINTQSSNIILSSITVTEQ